MFDDAEIPIPCGRCGAQTKKTVRWLQHNNMLICQCGTRIEVDAHKFNRKMREVDEAIDKFKRNLERFGR